MTAYLVTGGCGFIGSHLCEALLAERASVRVLDNLSTGSLDNVPAEVDVVRGDVTDADAVAAAMSGVDGCFHLAAIASVEHSKRDWLGTHRTNVTGAVTVFDAARQSGKRRTVPVVYASSAAVYGDCSQLPIREDAEKRPGSAYAADKYGCELHANVASALHGVPVTGLRFFNVYGPRQDPKSPYSGVISVFCDRMRRGQPIEVFGDGGQTRDFIFVEDVMTALVAAMRRRRAGSAVFNVCSGRETSVLQLASAIGKLCGREPEIRRRPRREGEIIHSCGDGSAARSQLGVPVATALPIGLQATLRWMEAIDKPGYTHAAMERRAAAQYLETA
jgi:UDP-glucose 4-epimerase